MAFCEDTTEIKHLSNFLANLPLASFTYPGKQPSQTDDVCSTVPPSAAGTLPWSRQGSEDHDDITPSACQRVCYQQCPLRQYLSRQKGKFDSAPMMVSAVVCSSDDEDEDEEVVQRIALAARRIALGARQI